MTRMDSHRPDRRAAAPPPPAPSPRPGPCRPPSTPREAVDRRRARAHLRPRLDLRRPRRASLKKPGDYLTYDLAGQPVIVLRDNDGAIRAMSNVCLHRMSTLLTGTGRRKVIICPYHAWTYDLDGTLRDASYMDRNDCFHREDMRLPQIRSEVWLGWIFITLNPDAAPGRRAPRRRSPPRSRPSAWRATPSSSARPTSGTPTGRCSPRTSWRATTCPPATPATIGGVSARSTTPTCPRARPPTTSTSSPRTRPSPSRSPTRPTPRSTGEWRLKTAVFAVYPSLMITLTPGYFWYLSLHPKGAGPGPHHLRRRPLARLRRRPRRARRTWRRLKALLDAVNAEDKGCTERVFRGVSSRLAAPGPISHLERPLYDFSRYLADRLAS